jgi:hypothetical protein
MRLLQTATGEIEEFIGQVPEYAILSHTWGEGEVSYQDLISGAEVQKKGWSKIRDSCARAAKDGWKYVWIDTCCINKESSAELSESINSMFAWYEQAAVVMPTWQMWMADQTIIKTSCASADGSREDGRCRNFWLPDSWSSWIKTGQIWELDIRSRTLYLQSRRSSPSR